MSGDETIYAVESDGARISHHRTVEGASYAVADDVRERMGRLGTGPITDDEHAALRRAVRATRYLNVNVHRGLGDSVPGIDIARLHQIAIAVARDYVIKQALLRD